MKTIISHFFIILLMLFPLSAKAAGENSLISLNVSVPARYLNNADKAEFAVSIMTEEGETDLPALHLTVDDQGMMHGSITYTLTSTYAATASWVDDPHVGFSFIAEPGTITINLNGPYMFSITGTSLNEAYSLYCNERNKLSSVSAMDSLAENYMKQYSDTPIFTHLFASHNAVSFGQKDIVEKLWNMAGERNKTIRRSLDDYNRVCKNNVSEGEPLRDVEIPNATVEDTGKSVRLSDFIGKGKWVFVDFWASWCVGCRQAIPIVKKAYEQVKDNNNIIFISIAEWDKRPAALKAMKEENMPWLQLIDEKGLCGSAYLFNTIPRFMLFAPDGTLYDKDVKRNNIINLLTHL